MSLHCPPVQSCDCVPLPLTPHLCLTELAEVELVVERDMRALRLVYFAAIVTMPGCIPTLVPPMRVSMGPAMSTGIRNVDADDYDRRMPRASADLVGAEIRASFEPLDLVGGDFFASHRIDLGVGYVFTTTGTSLQRFGHHGVFVETGLRLFAIRREEDDVRDHRLALHVAGEFLDRRYDGASGLGHGVRLSIDYERGFGFRAHRTPRSRRNGHSPWAGGVRGDSGVGASLGLAFRSFEGDRALTATLALTIRLPGVAGAIVFVR